MMDPDALRKMEEELLQLNQQLKEQQLQLNRLYAALRREQGAPPPAPEKAETPSLENYIGLRLIHLIGMIVLVIGISIGVKYAIDRNLISEGLRIALAYGAGALLYGLSERLRKSYVLFSAILFSGGVATLYFTTYGAHVYYGMLPFGLAFGLMILLTVFTVYKAAIYDREIIALLGLVGAYGIPFLISKNTDNPALLFLYISIINTGVVVLCLRRSWPLVGRIAQLVTWLLFLGWAAFRGSSGQDAVAYGFGIFFFLLFSFDALARYRLKGEPLGGEKVFQLLLNTLALYLAGLLVYPEHFNRSEIAPVSFVLTLIAGGQALLFHAWKEREARRSFLSAALLLGVIFLAQLLSGIGVTIAWTLLAIALFSLGALRRIPYFRLASILLIGATLAKLVVYDSVKFSPLQKVICYLLLGALLLVVSFFYQKFRARLFGDEEEGNGTERG
jgi:uncharacterized membrane protein